MPYLWLVCAYVNSVCVSSTTVCSNLTLESLSTAYLYVLSGSSLLSPAIPPNSTTSSTSPTPPWLQKQQPEIKQGVVQQLKQLMLQEQALLQQLGINDPLEIEFSNMVRPIMESCTKDSISVSNSTCLCENIWQSLFVSFASGWQGLDFHPL